MYFMVGRPPKSKYSILKYLFPALMKILNRSPNILKTLILGRNSGRHIAASNLGIGHCASKLSATVFIDASFACIWSRNTLENHLPHSEAPDVIKGLKKAGKILEIWPQNG